MKIRFSYRPELLHVLLLGFCWFPAMAAVPAPTPPPPETRIPPAGIAISDADRTELTAGAAELRREIDALAAALAGQPNSGLLPDVEIFHKAVDWALRYDEFFPAPKNGRDQVLEARHLLAQGRARAAELRRDGPPSWLAATGLIVRGHRSKLDGSIQPYGLYVPAGLKPGPNRLLVWLLGRNTKQSELAFIARCETQTPPVLPKDTIVLVPYGRFCNATKFAGEVDVFEAMAAVRQSRPIDPDRITVGGFSMGGASTWHLATHHAGLWCAAAPGAGFAETPLYTRAFAPGKEPPTWWEQKLWGWYDATLYAANLFNCPTVAYSGEIDPQKQSAEVMAAAMAAEGLKLEQLVGPNTGHAYHPETKQALTARLEALADRGRDPQPSEVRLTTYMARYPGDTWIEIRGLGRHWDRADLHAIRGQDGNLTLTTRNVTAVKFPTGPATAVIDGQRLALAAPESGEAVWLVKDGDRWRQGEKWTGLHKDRGLTGPIDDAFMEPFLFVRPTGKPLNERVGHWVDGEFAHATKLWRDLFRGEVRVKDDTALTDDDLASRNLVLWGDPASNRVLARIMAKLPLVWDARKIVFRGQTYDAAHHAPILIFPNPLNPRRYVVLNSGIDFRDHAYGTNALQIPKLPDYAVIDLNTPPGPRWQGKIVDAGFFDETWQ